MRLFLPFAIFMTSFMANASAQKARVVTRNLEPFSFQQDGKQISASQWSTLRERINQALITLHESGVTEKPREKYFGKPE